MVFEPLRVFYPSSLTIVIYSYHDMPVYFWMIALAPSDQKLVLLQMDIWTSIHSKILLLEPDLPPKDRWSFTWTVFLFLKSWGENGAIHVVSRGSQHHTLK